METPPVPILPRASELRTYTTSPPDICSPILRYDANEEEAIYRVYDAYDVESVSDKFSALHEALAIFPFSVEALNYWASLYVSEISPPDLHKAEKTYEMALTASRLMWPDMVQQSSIDWGHTEHRPFLRAQCGLARVQCSLGKVADAIEKFRFILKVNPNDNQGVKQLLFNALIQIGDYKLAEEIAEKHSEGRKSRQASFRYGFVIIDFLRFKLGVCSEPDLQDTLVQALMCNNYPPCLLLGDIPLPRKPDSYSSGGMEEAVCLVNDNKSSWERTPGLLEWLRKQRYAGGKKPNDDGSILFQLLTKGNMIVEKRNNAVWELTTKVDNIPGSATPDFYLAPGMKAHNRAKIVAFDLKSGFGCRLKFESFPYDDVVAVPFWKILNTSKALAKIAKNTTCKQCYEPASLQCTRCKVTWYCSEACQKKHWKGKGGQYAVSHKDTCPKLIKT
ncbi:hypothetical protein FRACYDRAFT_242548 [Fragilariopsis cylindrus CCMP1102]|uniref:MYND-type domain-containing protein n=1 Tax=Fragilariopsis cylindrus CCMP1102 TaxID=635003 RepID=A0A1E7F5I5_9STRA|nr:hypothetical protein FRACYDRAFT_242548 [Fragilariopsis cylindrus CCMP1102]|eukprot:OEU13123.1 hypothetical protein FRACYDRAFT_242548 [Fragilariopsis cylindrus CCMP1102]